MESSIENDSILSAASSATYREELISSEEQSILQSLQRGIVETTEENTALSKEISTFLLKLNLDVQSLPNDIQEGLTKIALILRSEELSDYDDTTLSIARERKKIEEKRRQREEKKLTRMHDDMLQKHTEFLRRLDHLQEAINSLENNIKDDEKTQEETRCNQILLMSKVQEYKQTLKKLETDLKDMQIEELYPQEILNRYEKYLEAKGELAELNQFLGEYRDLPPNLLQAKAALEAKRKEYDALQKTFIQKINSSKM